MFGFGGIQTATAQPCEGDCNGDSSVAINELILAVRIALGDAAVGDCAAVDRDNNGDVNISELVAAVTRALQGCTGDIDESALVASARIAVEPLIRVYDLGGAASGGGGGGGSAGRAQVGRPAGSSGCETFNCTLFGAFTGTEEFCCFGGEYRITWDNCVFDDQFGIVVSREGSFTLRSGDPSLCTGAVPPGASFEAIDDLFFSAEDSDGNFAAVSSDVSESFTAQSAGCTDEFGLGLFGDGTRFLNGERQDIVGDGFGNFSNVATDYDSLRIDVVSAVAPEGCAVGVAVNGGLTSNDFAAGTAFDATFEDFRIVQVPSGNALNLDISGTIGTDCIGDVSLVTTDPLRLVPGDVCISGGRIEAELDQGTVAVTYTASGGLDLDFGIDGSVDQSFSTCQELVSDDCVAPEAPGVCAACTNGEECETGLQCFNCAFNCTGDTLRCSLTDDFATCEDGVF